VHRKLERRILTVIAVAATMARQFDELSVGLIPWGDLPKGSHLQFARDEERATICSRVRLATKPGDDAENSIRRFVLLHGRDGVDALGPEECAARLFKTAAFEPLARAGVLSRHLAELFDSQAFLDHTNEFFNNYTVRNNERPDYIAVLKLVLPRLDANGFGAKTVEPCPLNSGRCSLTDLDLRLIRNADEQYARFVLLMLRDAYGRSNTTGEEGNAAPPSRTSGMEWLTRRDLMDVPKQVWFLYHLLRFWHEIERSLRYRVHPGPFIQKGKNLGVRAREVFINVLATAKCSISYSDDSDSDSESDA